MSIVRTEFDYEEVDPYGDWSVNSAADVANLVFNIVDHAEPPLVVMEIDNEPHAFHLVKISDDDDGELKPERVFKVTIEERPLHELAEGALNPK
jgi:hypothetical protein